MQQQEFPASPNGYRFAATFRYPKHFLYIAKLPPTILFFVSYLLTPLGQGPFHSLATLGIWQSIFMAVVFFSTDVVDRLIQKGVSRLLGYEVSFSFFDFPVIGTYTAAPGQFQPRRDALLIAITPLCLFSLLLLPQLLFGFSGTLGNLLFFFLLLNLTSAGWDLYFIWWLLSTPRNSIVSSSISGYHALTPDQLHAESARASLTPKLALESSTCEPIKDADRVINPIASIEEIAADWTSKDDDLLASAFASIGGLDASWTPHDEVLLTTTLDDVEESLTTLSTNADDIVAHALDSLRRKAKSSLQKKFLRTDAFRLYMDVALDPHKQLAFCDLPANPIETPQNAANQPALILAAANDVLQTEDEVSEIEKNASMFVAKGFVGSGFLDLNPTLIKIFIPATSYQRLRVTIEGRAKEGLIHQHASKKGAQRVAEALAEQLRELNYAVSTIKNQFKDSR